MDKSIEDMEKELLEAEYGLVFKSGYSKAVAPDGWTYEDRFSASEKPSFIPRVYAHLEREKQNKAMRELLEKIAAYETPSDLLWDEEKDAHLWNWFFDVQEKVRQFLKQDKP